MRSEKSIKDRVNKKREKLQRLRKNHEIASQTYGQDNLKARVIYTEILDVRGELIELLWVLGEDNVRIEN